MHYEVIVGNIGLVYSVNNPIKAKQKFSTYRLQSQSRNGKSSGESVVIFRDGEIWLEFIGRNESTLEER